MHAFIHTWLEHRFELQAPFDWTCHNVTGHGKEGGAMGRLVWPGTVMDGSAVRFHDSICLALNLGGDIDSMGAKYVSVLPLLVSLPCLRLLHRGKKGLGGG